ncbi:hypothetical protein KGM_202300 [Danaus plexippus plexippus]|uniref:Uncharacterized protein n=1 Tax=Danaus plexippus plexippus TaxID=278856 RepID=A0A212ENL4_DANPL|nr:hypothetical protein KGM_202300 [Danaus plexippus plexippus]
MIMVHLNDIRASARSERAATVGEKYKSQHLRTDIPSQVPPLTPGTNKKMAEALKATFASWEKEQLRLGVPKVGRMTHVTREVRTSPVVTGSACVCGVSILASGRKQDLHTTCCI